MSIALPIIEPPNNSRSLAEFDHHFACRYQLVAGVDEVGRGAIAGPIVAAAVLLPAGMYIPGVDDSKKIIKSKHSRLYSIIRSIVFDYAFAVVSSREIDRIGISAANSQVLRQAVQRLRFPAQIVFSDWYAVPGLASLNVPLAQGDSHSMAIASASLLAKYFRDRIMRAYHFHGMEVYNLRNNAGYGTPEHLRAISAHGITPIHRHSFLRRIG